MAEMTQRRLNRWSCSTRSIAQSTLARRARRGPQTHTTKAYLPSQYAPHLDQDLRVDHRAVYGLERAGSSPARCTFESRAMSD